METHRNTQQQLEKLGVRKSVKKIFQHGLSTEPIRLQCLIRQERIRYL